MCVSLNSRLERNQKKREGTSVVGVEGKDEAGGRAGGDGERCDADCDCFLNLLHG